MLFLNKKYKKNEGFTLIELCIAMTVLGVLLVPLLIKIDQYTKAKARDDTIRVISSLTPAYSEYFYNFNHHPCPADPALAEGDANYGIEMNCTALTDAVVTGMIPFKTLNIPESLVIDGWKNRFTYAVTRNLTLGTVLPSAPGGITTTELTFDAATGTIFNLPTATPAQYLIVSHGDNGVGAQSASGVLVENCAWVGAGPAPVERENCDGDDTYTKAATYQFVTYADTADYFDDIVEVIPQVRSRIWSASAAKREDVYSKVDRIGIGTDDPQTQVDIAGNMQASNIETNAVCDATTGACFNPEMIAGVDPNMDCSGPSSRPMVGIQSGAAVCGESPFTGGTASICDPGEYAVGFNAAGVVICE